MGFGAFSRIWSTADHWKTFGGNGSWSMTRSIITLGGKGTSGTAGQNQLNLCGALFHSHAKHGQIDVHLRSTNKAHNFYSSARVPYTGDIWTLSPIPSMELELFFPENPVDPALPATNDWEVRISATGLDLPHRQKNGVEGWFGVLMMVTQY